MRRKRLLLVLMSALALGGIALVLGLWPGPASRLSHENIERIQVGMNRPEVEAILGPPGDYTTGPQTDPLLIAVQQGHIEYPVADGMLNICAWANDKEAIWVSFDNSKIARDVIRCPAGTKLNQTPLENLFWRMRRGLFK